MVRKEKVVELEDGRIQIQDAETGEPLITQHTKPSLEKRKKAGQVSPYAVRYDRFRWGRKKNGKYLLVKVGAEKPDDLPDDYIYLRNDRETQLKILDLLLEGRSLRLASKEVGLPYHVVQQALIHDPHFQAEIKKTRVAASENYRQKLVAIAHETTEENAKAQKVKADIYKWLMASDDKATYGSASKTVGDNSTTVNITFSTGIDRGVDTIAAVPVRELIEEVMNEPKDTDGVRSEAPASGTSQEPEEV